MTLLMRQLTSLLISHPFSFDSLEYFSMLYLRAAGSIQLFPRAAFLLFLLYHTYLYSFPAGFHLLALLVFFLLLTWLMVLTVRKMEYPAYMAGEVSLEQPR
jgi:hypothetical protein